MVLTLRWIATVLCALLLLAWIGVWLGGSGGTPLAFIQRVTGLRLGASVQVSGSGISLPAGFSMGGPFALVDQTGKRVTDADFRGKWLLLYFGYTTCPDVCPTELQTITAALDQLGQKASLITPVFITVDPQRDTPAVLAPYVAQFSDRMVGLTGTASEIAQVTREFRVYYAKAPSKTPDTYLMDHSSFVYLVGPDGVLRGLFRPDTTASALATDIGNRL